MLLNSSRHANLLADWCFSRRGFGPVNYVVFLESPLTIAFDKIDNIR